LVYKALNDLSLQYMADDCQFTDQPTLADFNRPTSLRVRFKELV